LSVSVTTVPTGKLAVQVGGQSMPAGDEVIEPKPLPPPFTLSVVAKVA
jgi:hypothetical protein